MGLFSSRSRSVSVPAAELIAAFGSSGAFAEIQQAYAKLDSLGPDPVVDFGADPTGATDATALLTQACNALPSGGIVPISGILRVASNFTFPTGVVPVQRGLGRFKINNGKTLTLPSGFAASEFAWLFDVSAGGNVASAIIAEWWVRWFGAKGDFTGDDGVPINQAFAASKASGRNAAVRLGAGRFRHTTPIAYGGANQGTPFIGVPGSAFRQGSALPVCTLSYAGSTPAPQVTASGYPSFEGIAFENFGAATSAIYTPSGAHGRGKNISTIVPSGGTAWSECALKIWDFEYDHWQEWENTAAPALKFGTSGTIFWTSDAQFDPASAAANHAWQAVWLDKATGGGQWTVAHNGNTTAPIPSNATAPVLQDAIEALPHLCRGAVNVVGGYDPVNHLVSPYYITFGARVDAGCVLTKGSATVLDASITADSTGFFVTGDGVPPNTYVGTVTPGVSFKLSSSRTSQVDVVATKNVTTNLAIKGAGLGAVAVPALTADASSLTGPGAWQATHTYGLNQQVVPTVPNGHRYICTVAGTTSGVEPVWPTTSGATVVNGGVTWTEAGAVTTPVVTVSDATPLIVPVGTADGITIGPRFTFDAYPACHTFFDNSHQAEYWQAISTGASTGGTFTVAYKGVSSAPIPWNADRATADAAINAVSTIAADGGVIVRGGDLPSHLFVTFKGSVWGLGAYPALTVNSTGLTDGTATVTLPTLVEIGSLTVEQGEFDNNGGSASVLSVVRATNARIVNIETNNISALPLIDGFCLLTESVGVANHNNGSSMSATILRTASRNAVAQVGVNRFTAASSFGPYDPTSQIGSSIEAINANPGRDVAGQIRIRLDRGVQGTIYRADVTDNSVATVAIAKRTDSTSPGNLIKDRVFAVQIHNASGGALTNIVWTASQFGLATPFVAPPVGAYLTIYFWFDGQKAWELIRTGPWHTGDIADGAITTPKLADGSVTAIKLASGVGGGSGGVDLSRPPNGAIAESLPRDGAFSNSALFTSGRQFFVMTREVIPAGTPISTISFFSGSTAPSALVNQWFGLWDLDGNLLALTADDLITPWASSVEKKLRIARRVTDASINNGSPVVASAAAAFTSDDVGRQVTVVGAGSAGGPLGTSTSPVTVVSVDPADNEATLSANALTDVLAGGTLYIATPCITTSDSRLYVSGLINGTVGTHIAANQVISPISALPPVLSAVDSTHTGLTNPASAPAVATLGAGFQLLGYAYLT